MRPLVKKDPTTGVVVISHDGGHSWQAAPQATGTTAEALRRTFAAIGDTITDTARPAGPNS